MVQKNTLPLRTEITDVSQDKDEVKVLMWIGKQVTLSLIEKEMMFLEATSKRCD